MTLTTLPLTTSLALTPRCPYPSAQPQPACHAPRLPHAPCVRRYSCKVPPTARHQEGGVDQYWADRLKEVEEMEKMIPTTTTTVPDGCEESVEMVPAGLQAQSVTVLQDSVSASDRVEQTALPQDAPHFGKNKLRRRTHVDDKDLPCAGGSAPPPCRCGLPLLPLLTSSNAVVPCSTVVLRLFFGN